MKTQNTVQLVGYLGGDPVLQNAINGKPYTKIRMATDYYRRMEDGTVIKKATWHTVLVWNKLARSVRETFIKGSHIMIRGQICNNHFTGRDGNRRFSSHVRASVVIDLDR